MEKTFDLAEVSLIIHAEEATLARYRRAISTYAKKFKRYGVSITVEIGWGMATHHNESDVRPKIESTYSAFIVCKIMDRDGHIVESNDHDMYMDFAWPLSRCVNNRVLVFLDIDEDLFDLMSTCEDYFHHPFCCRLGEQGNNGGQSIP